MKLFKNNNVNPGFDNGLAFGIIKAIRISIGFDLLKLILLWKRYRTFKKLNSKRLSIVKDKNLTIPPLLILSVNMKCNLNCSGCYSRKYPEENELSIEEIHSLLSEAEELGISFVVITGGEPLMKEGLIKLLKQHPKLTFLLFTNGTFISTSFVKELKQLNNICPIISIEGNAVETDERRGKGVYEQALKAMSILNSEKVFFGYSVTVTSKNINPSLRFWASFRG